MFLRSGLVYMKIHAMRIAKRTLLFSSLLCLCSLILFSCNIFWKSPSFYELGGNREMDIPIMDMQSYDQIRKTHRRPYCYSVGSATGGKVYVVGVDHLNDPGHSQFDTIRSIWVKAEPTVALVEGRLGFLFAWFQDPIEKYGAGGLVSQLSKNDGTELYTWEPTRDDEIGILMKQFPVEQIAMFYTFRPYFSKMREGKPKNPEKKIAQYLRSRTDYEHIRGVFKTWKELDSAWQKDYPHINWRGYSDEQGWPEGYLHNIWNASNLARDHHLVQIVAELVDHGETVFISMGTSHAPRIEEALRAALL